MLEDRFGRRFYYLRLSVTDVCNFRCNYCLPEGYSATDEAPHLSGEEIARVVRAFAALGTQKVRLTGGEPSLRADLPEIINSAKETPGIRKVAVTSNGYKLPKVIDSWRQAGLDQLNVSLDSLQADEFARITGHDCLPRLLTGIDRALELGIATKVNAMLLHDGAERRLSEFLQWLRDTPVTLRFIELMRTGDNRDFFVSNHLRATTVEQRLLREGWKLVAPARDAGPAREYQHPEYRGRIGVITPYSDGFCDSCNRLRVSAQGRLHLCLFAEQGLDLREAIGSGDIGLLVDRIRHLVAGKAPSHYLQREQVGATRNLAMLGG